MIRLRRVGIVIGIALIGVVASTSVAAAHPLGNFSVNRYDGVVVSAESIQVRHVVDLAEIPTVQETPRVDSSGDDVLSTAELQAYGEDSCAATAPNLRLSVAGQRTPLTVTAATATTGEGQAGLSTLRLRCELSAPVQLTESPTSITFADHTDTADVGWREITLVGDGVTLADSTVPADSISDELTAYPEELLESPLNEASATATATRGGPALDAANAATTSGSDSQSAGFGSQLLTDVTKSATGPLGMTLALLVAVGVGAAHAVAPGHGKSLVAFALAGRREHGVRAAAAVGVTVTATHTASVLVLGLLIATASQAVSASVYPLLGLISGLLIVGLGLVLIRSALRGTPGHSHGHDHDHDHDHHEHSPHSHDDPHSHAAVSTDSGGVATLARPLPAQHSHAVAPTHRRGVLVSLGVVGGLIPSPTAIVVLLATVAAGQAWFGVVLVIGFGVGMALTLASVALLVLRAQDRVLDRLSAGAHSRLSGVLQRLPLATATIVCAVGVTLVVQSWP